MKALRKLGKYRVEVFVPGAGDDYEIGGVKVQRFATRQLPSNVFPFLFSGWNQKSFLEAVENAGIRVEDVAVCHAHTAALSVYAMAIKERNPKCLTLLHHHDLASFGLNVGRLHTCWLYNIVEFPILRKWHERIDCHVFLSEASRRSFLAAPDASWTVYKDYKKQMKWLPYRPVRIKRSIVLHNGVDTSLFKVGERKPHEGFVIGCVANYEVLKDQMTLLRAVNILNHGIHGKHGNVGDGFSRAEHVERVDGGGVNHGIHGKHGIRVMFVGSGSERERCERFAMERGIDVEFRDEVRHEKLTDFYREMDLFVLPSFFEGFGCVFTEAWACGVPFMTCEGQGIEDVIAHEERGKWLFKPHDAEGLADRIAKYMEERCEQKLCGEIGIDKLVDGFLKELAV